MVKKLWWRITFGVISIDERLFYRRGQLTRPFSLAACVKCRGISRPLQRSITDFGSDVSFAKVAKKLMEHYGIQVPLTAIVEVTEHHGQVMGQDMQRQRKIIWTPTIFFIGTRWNTPCLCKPPSARGRRSKKKYVTDPFRSLRALRVLGGKITSFPWPRMPGYPPFPGFRPMTAPEWWVSWFSMALNRHQAAVGIAVNRHHPAVEIAVNRHHPAVGFAVNRHHPAVEIAVNRNQAAVGIAVNRHHPAVGFAVNPNHPGSRAISGKPNFTSRLRATLG